MEKKKDRIDRKIEMTKNEKECRKWKWENFNGVKKTGNIAWKQYRKTLVKARGRNIGRKWIKEKYGKGKWLLRWSKRICRN